MSKLTFDLYPFTLPKNIFEAVLKNDKQSVKFFVEEMNDTVRTANEVGQTLGHAAAFHGFFDILRYLIRKDPSIVNINDRWNYTMLHMAVENGTLDTVRYLVDDCNADIHKPVCELYFGNKVSHIAAEEGHLDVFKYLIEEKKMDPTERNSEGQTPAFLAANFDHLSVIQYLVEHTNATFNTVDNKGRSILHLIASYTNRSLRVPKYLLDEKKIPLDLNVKDNDGVTTVSSACNYYHYDIIKYLVGEKGANVSICDNVGRTPLHQAAEMNSMEIVKYLVEHGADPSAKDHDERWAIELTGDSEIADYLEVAMWKNASKPSTRKPQMNRSSAHQHPQNQSQDYKERKPESDNREVFDRDPRHGHHQNQNGDNREWKPDRENIDRNAGYRHSGNRDGEYNANQPRESTDGYRSYSSPRPYNPRDYGHRPRRNIPELIRPDSALENYSNSLIRSRIDTNLVEPFYSMALGRNNISVDQTDVRYSYANILLLLGNTSMRYIERPSDFLLTPEEMLRRRVDKIAIDAINSAVYE